MSEIKKLFGFNNQWGRPLPYVLFLIIAVSLLPTIIISSVTNGIDCEKSILLDDDGKPILPENFKNKMHSTQAEALKECKSITESSMMTAQITGVIFSIVLLYSLILHPWINSDKNKDIESKRSTPI